jgi:hypothetical protein
MLLLAIKRLLYIDIRPDLVYLASSLIYLIGDFKSKKIGVFFSTAQSSHSLPVILISFIVMVRAGRQYNVNSESVARSNTQKVIHILRLTAPIFFLKIKIANYGKRLVP